MSTVTILQIDPEVAARGLAERAPAIEELIEALEETQRTTWETMQISFDI
ncbi:MAG: hypothetical protein JNK33_05075 [Candidatus Doudnabacteria bacterium]|nr:hypothetical protein [Candidatus Doudnabacteria bacterium]